MTFRPASSAEVLHLIDDAFHYRGDVTLHLRSGEQIAGYVFNRNPDAVPPYLQFFLQGQTAPRQIPYSDIVAVNFSGDDTASGKDWEAWAKKKESERQAEASRIEAAARARGHL
jgi:hypothetical protein